MKSYVPFWCLFSLVFQTLSAQIVDHSHSFGTISMPKVVRPMVNGQWLVVGKGIPRPGEFQFQEDTFFVQVFAHDGQLLTNQKILFGDGLTHYLHDAWPLADGTFLISQQNGWCSGDYTYGGIRKYGLDGQLIWALEGSDGGAVHWPPMNWTLTPDNQVIGLKTDTLWKVNTTTGTEIWRAPLVGLGPSGIFYDRYLIPGTEDFIGVGVPSFQKWKQTNGPAGPKYVLQNALTVPGITRGLGFSPEGWYYATVGYTSTILERVNANFEHEVLNLAINLDSLDWRQGVVGPDGLYFLGRHNQENWLIKTDFLGQHPVELPLPEPWVHPSALATQVNSVAVIGVDGSGPESIPSDYPSEGEFQTMRAWTRIFPTVASLPGPDITDAGVTGIQQLSTVDTTVQVLPFSHLYTLNGGNFQVRITNLGNTLLEQVYVNFSFGRDFNNCSDRQAVQYLYTGLHLMPGESTWVNFGNLSDQKQTHLPEHFCFWTAGPNYTLDAQHEDDFYCQPAAYTVATYTAFLPVIRLLPNPVQDQFELSDSTIRADTEWRLTDAAGRLVQRGIYPAGQSSINVSTLQLPNGLYFFRFNNRVSKLIVQH